MLALVMTRQGRPPRRQRVAARVLRRNAALGCSRLGFGELVNHWITYWHFASVARRIAGAQFGNVPASRTARELAQSQRSTLPNRS